MKLFWIFFALNLFTTAAHAQRLFFDPRHFQAVIENAAIQSSAEITHSQYLGKIDGNLQMINTNVGSVVLVQTMIYQSLANVNSALKNGLVVKDMTVIVGDILSYTDQTISLAKAEPYLLLFAESYAKEIRERTTRLVSDVSGFILKEGDNMLADYNSRDQLLIHVRRELQIINGMAYGAWKSMFWARQKGIIALLNPFASFINNDRIMVEDIIRDAKYLKQ